MCGGHDKSRNESFIPSFRLLRRDFIGAQRTYRKIEKFVNFYTRYSIISHTFYSRVNVIWGERYA